MSDFLRWVAGVQAAYFVITGVWPIVHMPSFLAVTGPKVDLWLVKTVGALVAVVGLAVGIAGWRGQASAEVVTLAVGSAAALGAVDVIHVKKRVIAPIYLLDAVAEAVIILAWIVGLALMRG
jgi:hypothetical protein